MTLLVRGQLSPAGNVLLYLLGVGRVGGRNRKIKAGYQTYIQSRITVRFSFFFFFLNSEEQAAKRNGGIFIFGLKISMNVLFDVLASWKLLGSVEV